jgi:hypothetical protein
MTASQVNGMPAGYPGSPMLHSGQNNHPPTHLPPTSLPNVSSSAMPPMQPYANTMYTNLSSLPNDFNNYQQPPFNSDYSTSNSTPTVSKNVQDIIFWIKGHDL